MTTIINDPDGNNITNNNITFNSDHFTEIDTNYISFSGELSLTTTNSKYSSSNKVKSIEVLDENNNKLGELDTTNIKFKKSKKTIIPFNFGDTYSGNSAKKIKIGMGSDGIGVYKFDISACNTNISHIVPNNRQWVKNKTQTFTFDSAMPLSDCPIPNVDGMNKYLGNGSAYVIMKPENLSYLDNIEFGYTANNNSIIPDFTYIIYGSDSKIDFNEIVYTSSSAQNKSIDYPKPFNYYKLVITSVSTNNITLSNITPTFTQFSIDTGLNALNRDQKQHFEHFSNRRENINELIVPGIITLLFISVLSLRK